jgi:hypothetical protein
MGRDAPEVSLYAISIPPLNKMTIDMSPELEEIIPLATELVTAEARAATGH